MARIAMFQDCPRLELALLVVIAPEVAITRRFYLVPSDLFVQTSVLKLLPPAQVATYVPATQSRRHFVDPDTFVRRVPHSS